MNTAQVNDPSEKNTGEKYRIWFIKLFKISDPLGGRTDLWSKLYF